MSYVRNTTIQCDQSNSSTVYQNGDYVVDLGKSIEVQNGTQIQLSMAVINSQFSESDNIIFDEDVLLTILVTKVDYNYRHQDAAGSNNVKRKGISSTNAFTDDDYEPYLMYSVSNIERLDSQDFFLQQADGGEFQVRCAVTYQFINSNGLLKTQTYSGKNQLNVGDSATVTPLAGESPIEFKAGTLRIASISSRIYIPSSGTHQKGDSKQCIPKAQNITNVSSGDRSLDKDILSIQIPAGTYSPNSLTELMNQLFTDAGGFTNSLSNTAGERTFAPSNRLINSTDDTSYNEIVFNKMDDEEGKTVSFTNSNTYRYEDGSGNVVPYFLGASQFSFSYGQHGAVYSLDSAHTPLYNYSSHSSATTDISENVGFFEITIDGVKQYRIVDRASCIAVLEMTSQGVDNPDKYTDFWDTIIPIRSKLECTVYSDSNGVEYITKSDMLDKTIGGFSGIQTFFPDYNPFPDTSSFPKYLDVTGQTSSIQSDLPIFNTDQSSMFLIEASFINQTDVVIGESLKSSVIAYGSFENTYNDFVILNSTNSIPVVHRGETYTFNRVRVRILDVNDLKPVNGLLDNNHVTFLVATLVEEKSE